MISNNEFLVLAALATAGEAYGRQLIDVAANIPNGRRLTLGSLYPTLSRMESKGFVEARWGEEAEVRQNARRRYYRLTADGEAVLRQTHESLQFVFGALPVPFGRA